MRKPGREVKRDRAAAIRHPVYVNSQGARVGLDGLTLVVATKGKRHGVRLDEVSELVPIGNIHVTTPALHELMRRGIPVCWMTSRGWFLGATTGFGHGDGALRAAQHRAAADANRRVAFARTWVAAKIRNARILLRRNGRGGNARTTVRRLADLAKRADNADDLDRLRGFEGAAAAAYFGAFPSMIRRRGNWAIATFKGRNRRPPADPINAALSFLYAVQIRSWTAALSGAGLDVFAGFLHGFRHGRPALALDMVEPSRPRVADSVVLRTLNTGMLSADHFDTRDSAVLLDAQGRKVLLDALEDRLEQTVRHDALNRDIAYRDLPSVESRRLAAALRHEEPPPPAMAWK